MAFGREYEIARPSALPDWLKEFADGALRRSADEGNPFQELQGIFQKNKDLGAIEARVRELKDRIGLSRLAEEDETSPTIKNASVKKGSIARLAKLANLLDEHGYADEAQDIDSIIRSMASEETKKLFNKYPKLQNFIDNVIRSRGGHITVPAVLKMVRDERPEEADAATDQDLKKYIEENIKNERLEMNDASDSVAGLGVGLSTSWEDDAENNRMFESPKPAK